MGGTHVVSLDAGLGLAYLSQPKRLKIQIDRQQTIQQLISTTHDGNGFDGRTHIVDDNKDGEQSVRISPNTATLLHPERLFFCSAERDTSMSFILYVTESRVSIVITTSSLMGQELSREQLFLPSVTLRRFLPCPSHSSYLKTRPHPQKKSKRDASQNAKSDPRPSLSYLHCFSNKKQPHPSSLKAKRYHPDELAEDRTRITRFEV